MGRERDDIMRIEAYEKGAESALKSSLSGLSSYTEQIWRCGGCDNELRPTWLYCPYCSREIP